MSVFEKTTTVSLLSLIITVVALTIFTAPSSAGAEQLLLLHYPPAETLSLTEASRQKTRRPLDIRLDENGKLALRSGDVLLTMAYCAPDEEIETVERIRSVRLQKSGISLKVSFLF